MSGKVVKIVLRPKRKNIPIEVDFAIAIENLGLEGDHYNKPNGSRQITIIEENHLKEASEVLNVEVTPILTRRNIVVSDLSLSNIPLKTHFRLGEALLIKTGDCPPCERMNENLGLGGRIALEGKGGITAKIINGGKIKIGDEVTLDL